MLTVMPLFIGTSELLLIAALVLLLFGGKKLPEMMRGLGQGVKAFKEGMKEPDGTKPNETNEPERSDVSTENVEPMKDKSVDESKE